MRSLSLEPGTETSSWYAELALRSLVSKSATGSVIVMMCLLSRLVSSTRTRETTWVVHERPGPAARGSCPDASVGQAEACPILTVMVNYLRVLLEREAELSQESASFLIRLRGGNDSDVETAHAINLILIDLVKYTLFGQTEGVVTVSVELLG